MDQKNIGAIFKLGLFYALCLLNMNCSAIKYKVSPEKISPEKVTILVTDSGLGGLSVAAYLEQLFREKPVVPQVEIIFVNALYESGYGYNSMKSTAEKVTVFNTALQAFNARFKPDMILIACNTLSVIYPYTDFAKSGTKPTVFSIVDDGVTLMQEYLQQHPTGAVIITGTPTTVGQNTHREKLLAAGFDSTRIVTQAFPTLESEIQDDPNSDMVQSLIEMYASECVDACPENADKFGVALFCTHYSYSIGYFQRIFSDLLNRPVTILNPNQGMAQTVFARFGGNVKKSVVKLEVISRVPISEGKRQNIGVLLAKTSPALTEALHDYQYDPDLFKINK